MFKSAKKHLVLKVFFIFFYFIDGYIIKLDFTCVLVNQLFFS